MLSSIKDRVQNIDLATVEVTLLLLLLLVGVPMIVLIPPGAGYDEEDHLVRVWEMSAFSFLPGQMSAQEMQYPTLFRDFAYRQQGSTGILGSEFWQKYTRASLDEYGFVRREINTKSVYSPPLLFPQALIMRVLGRRADLPALFVFYVCRLASLLSYLLLVWLAIRLIPFGKWILLVLALTPMAVFQATTISPDAISNGIGFLFIAGCLRATEIKEINWKEVGKLILLIFLLFLAKLNLVVLILLPFLLLPPARFPKKGIYVFLLGMTAVLFLMETVGWYIIASARSDPLLTNDANPVAQLRYMVNHPFTFPQAVIRDLIANGWTYVQGWINGYGYYYWTPPQIVSLLFLASLGFGVVKDPIRLQLDRKSRITFLLVFVTGYFATAGAMYTTFTPVGSDQIFGIQGRYLIPLVLLLVLSLAGLVRTRKAVVSSPKWTVIFLSTALFLNVLGIFLSFHVPCGSTFYQTGLCYRPLFRDFSGEVRASPSISNDALLAQEIQVQCNGLTELRLWMQPSSPGDGGITRFVLETITSSKARLDTSIPNDQITTEGWYSLHFSPDWYSAGTQYILIVSSTDTSESQGLRLFYTSQSSFDLGNLYENGIPMEEDLILQYGCATGLRKLWLTGKP